LNIALVLATHTLVCEPAKLVSLAENHADQGASVNATGLLPCCVPITRDMLGRRYGVGPLLVRSEKVQTDDKVLYGRAGAGRRGAPTSFARALLGPAWRNGTLRS
jgi:hypothetical protein